MKVEFLLSFKNNEELQKLDESFISSHLRIDDYIMRHIQDMNIEGYRVPRPVIEEQE